YWETRTETREVTGTREVQGDAGRDTLAFAAGIAPTDIWLRRDGGDLVVGVAGPGTTSAGFDALADRVRLKDWADVNDRVETLRFSDGSSIDIGLLFPRLGTQPINLAAGDDTNDTLSGTSGDDTFFFRRGDGSDVLSSSNDSTTTDRVVF